jgi:hypothetical protein
VCGLFRSVPAKSGKGNVTLNGAALPHLQLLQHLLRGEAFRDHPGDLPLQPRENAGRLTRRRQPRDHLLRDLTGHIQQPLPAHNRTQRN